MEAGGFRKHLPQKLSKFIELNKKTKVDTNLKKTSDHFSDKIGAKKVGKDGNACRLS